MLAEFLISSLSLPITGLVTGAGLARAPHAGPGSALTRRCRRPRGLRSSALPGAAYAAESRPRRSRVRRVGPPGRGAETAGARERRGTASRRCLVKTRPAKRGLESARKQVKYFL